MKNLVLPVEMQELFTFMFGNGDHLTWQLWKSKKRSNYSLKVLLSQWLYMMLLEYSLR